MRTRARGRRERWKRKRGSGGGQTTTVWEEEKATWVVEFSTWVAETPAWEENAALASQPQKPTQSDKKERDEGVLLRWQKLKLWLSWQKMKVAVCVRAREGQNAVE